MEKCRAKYTASWTKLSKLVSSPSCAGDRFMDNGATFTDRLSTLVWEKKTTAVNSGEDFDNPSDVDNGYALDFAHPDDGSAYTLFLQS